MKLCCRILHIRGLFSFHNHAWYKGMSKVNDSIQSVIDFGQWLIVWLLWSQKRDAISWFFWDGTKCETWLDLVITGIEFELTSFESVCVIKLNSLHISVFKFYLFVLQNTLRWHLTKLTESVFESINMLVSLSQLSCDAKCLLFMPFLCRR